MEIKEGYWRYNIYNNTILPCVNKPENGKGGFHSECVEGLVGPLC